MFKRFVKRYFYTMVKRHLIRSNYTNDLDFYRDVTFLKSFIIIHPFTVLPIFLGIQYAYQNANFSICYWSLFSYSLLWIITVPSRLSIFLRKLILTIFVYNYGFQLLVNSGMDYSGILFWTIGNVMMALFFKRDNYLLIIIINILMAFLIGAIIYFEVKTIFFSENLSLSDWTLIALINVFLSVILSVLFSRLIEHINNTIYKHRRLKSEFIASNLMMKENNKLLKQKNLELEQMAYVTSHDLQEPLRMISSFSMRILEKYNSLLNNYTKQTLVTSLESVNRMKITISDILEFSVMDLENKQKDKINVSKMIHQLLIKKRMKHIPKVTILINQEIVTYLKPLTRIFDNLISNSVKAHLNETPLGIVISCIEEAGYYNFTYLDDVLHLNEYQNEDQNELNKDANSHLIERLDQNIIISKLLIEQLDGEICVELVDQIIVIYFKIPTNAAL